MVLVTLELCFHLEKRHQPSPEECKHILAVFHSYIFHQSKTSVQTK